MAARAEQLIARGDFNQDRNVAPWRDRHSNQRHSKTEDLVGRVVEAEPLVFARRIPPFELHHELHALG